VAGGGLARGACAGATRDGASALKEAHLRVPPGWGDDEQHPIYIYMYVCMYACMYVYLCMYLTYIICISMYVHVCMYVLYACLYVSIHTLRPNAYVCIHDCMCVCVCVCMHECMHECMYVCMYVHVSICARASTKARSVCAPGYDRAAVSWREQNTSPRRSR
jgi:hypothetical protein